MGAGVMGSGALEKFNGIGIDFPGVCGKSGRTVGAQHIGPDGTQAVGLGWYGAAPLALREPPRCVVPQSLSLS